MSTMTATIIEMLGKLSILPQLKDEANLNTSMYQNYTNVEKAILLYLARRGKLGSNVTIKSVDKLRNKYELRDLEDAWENLKNHAIVRGNLGGGNINGPEVLKLVEGKLIYSILIYDLHVLATKIFNRIKDLLAQMLSKRP